MRIFRSLITNMWSATSAFIREVAQSIRELELGNRSYNNYGPERCHTNGLVAIQFNSIILVVKCGYRRKNNLRVIHYGETCWWNTKWRRGTPHSNMRPVSTWRHQQMAIRQHRLGPCSAVVLRSKLRLCMTCMNKDDHSHDQLVAWWWLALRLGSLKGMSWRKRAEVAIAENK